MQAWWRPPHAEVTEYTLKRRRAYHTANSKGPARIPLFGPEYRNTTAFPLPPGLFGVTVSLQTQESAKVEPSPQTTMQDKMAPVHRMVVVFHIKDDSDDWSGGRVPWSASWRMETGKRRTTAGCAVSSSSAMDLHLNSTGSRRNNTKNYKLITETIFYRSLNHIKIKTVCLFKSC